LPEISLFINTKSRRMTGFSVYNGQLLLKLNQKKKTLTKDYIFFFFFPAFFFFATFFFLAIVYFTFLSILFFIFIFSIFTEKNNLNFFVIRPFLFWKNYF
jgi:hypothetical protein